MRIRVRKVDNQFLHLDIFYFCGGQDLKAQYHKKTNRWTYRKFHERNGVYADIHVPTENERAQVEREAAKHL